MSARGKSRTPKQHPQSRKIYEFVPPTTRTVSHFRKKCDGILPYSRIYTDPRSQRRSHCVRWVGAYRIDRLRSDPRMSDGTGNYSPGIPYCGKTSARLIAYYVCSGGKEPPVSYKGTHCKNPFCVNPWHVAWHNSARNEAPTTPSLSSSSSPPPLVDSDG